jgi:threonine synthase
VSAVSMGEGNTPLVASVSAPGVYFKLENVNPSGSYKDRFIAAEMTAVVAAGKRACVATSSGNTGAALAAWCARLSLRCVILVNQDVPSGKLMQMRAHGAIVVRIPQFTTAPAVTEAVFAQLGEFAASGEAALIVSAYRFCPVGMRGVESISGEIAARLPQVEHVFVPVGGGGLFSAVTLGFAGCDARPKVHAVQPEGCPTVLNAVRSNGGVSSVESTTAISGLSVPFDIDAGKAVSLLREHGGMAVGVTDDEVFEAQSILLRREGIYSEPAGAAAFAGYRKTLAAGRIGSGQPCVCLVTGSGAKDPHSIEAAAERTPSPIVESGQVLDQLKRLARGME